MKGNSLHFGTTTNESTTYRLELGNLLLRITGNSMQLMTFYCFARHSMSLEALRATEQVGELPNSLQVLGV